jgi:hypothetical protein
MGAAGQRHAESRSAAAADNEEEVVEEDEEDEEEEEEEDEEEEEEEDEEDADEDEARKMAGVMKSTRSSSNIMTAGTDSARPASTHCSQPAAGTTSCG